MSSQVPITLVMSGISLAKHVHLGLLHMQLRTLGGIMCGVSGWFVIVVGYHSKLHVVITSYRHHCLLPTKLHHNLRCAY